MKKVLSIALVVAFASSMATAQFFSPKLKVTQTKEKTTIGVYYRTLFNPVPLPKIVFLGFSEKLGTTKISFKTALLTDLIFDLDKAIFFPVGQLDNKGYWIKEFPFPSTGKKQFEFNVQANVLSFTIDIFKQTVVGKFLKTNLAKLAIYF